MLDDDFLESLGLADLLPAPLAAWRPLVSHAMSFFLDRLPEDRLAAIAADQFTLGEHASPARRLVSLFAQCPTLHKLGQVVARHRQLHPELRRLLQSLESMPPTLPTSAIAARLNETLGRELPITLADAPLAEGSVAAVLAFTYRENSAERHGVFKVLKPGIAQRLDEELAILAALAGYLEEEGARIGLPSLEYRDTLKSVEDLLRHEVRLDIEQANLRDAAALYAGEPHVLIPRLLPWCTPEVTAMERVFGVKLTEAELDSTARRNLADTAVSALLAQPFWRSEAQAVFHADLHGGNLLLADDGRLAVIDWSLTTRLDKAQREALVASALAALALDAAGIRNAIAALGSLSPDDPVLVEAVERALDRLVREGRLPGFDWLLGLLDDIALRIPMGFRGDFALFRKTWMSLSGVIHDLAGEHSPDVPLIATGARCFAAELPARLLAPPASRAFATHVSNQDLLRAGASSWLAATRYWARLWQGMHARLDASSSGFDRSG